MISMNHADKIISGLAWFKTPAGLVALGVSIVLGLVGAWCLDCWERGNDYYDDTKNKRWED